MLGLNQSVRKTPVSRSTTKLHNAISPSMNDQWSGKTFRICFLATPARPSRSSAQVAAAPALLGLLGLVPLVFAAAVSVIGHSPTFPEAWADRLPEVAERHQVAL